MKKCIGFYVSISISVSVSRIADKCTVKEFTLWL